MSISGVATTRQIGKIAASPTQPEANTTAANECDTNADTCCLGKNFVILEYTQRTADVYAYDKAIKPLQNVPIVTGATAWDDPITGETYIIVVNEALYYGTKLDHSLINPNQIRAFGLSFWDNPFDTEKGLCIDLDDVTTIQLKTKGTKIFFETRAPSERELRDCHRIDVTSKREWNPENVTMSKVQTRQTDDIEDGLKERMLAKVPHTIAEIMRYDGDLEDLPTRQTYTSYERHAKLSAEVLADRFGIGLERAKATLKATLQRGVRSAILPISRRYRADRQFGVKRLQGKFATDTMWAKSRSLNSNIATQIYSHKCGFSAAYHMDKANNENVGYTLRAFISDYGAPERLKYDGAAVQVGRKTIFQETVRKHDIKTHVSGPRRPNENPAEGAIREIKKKWYRIQAKKNIPDRLWDYGISYVCETANMTVNSSRYSNGRTPIECITGETPDLSEYLDFGFYDWVTYRTNAGLGKPELGRWLGVSHRVGQLMSYWILAASGITISCTTVQRVTHLEKKTEEYTKNMNEFQRNLERKWNVESANSEIIPNGEGVPNTNILSLDDEDDEFIEEFKRVIDDKELKDIDVMMNRESGTRDTYLNMELGFQRDEEGLHYARVKRRVIDADGTPVGVPNNNPLLDSRQYEVEFADGRSETLTANVIAENILAQVDEHGHRHMLIEEIEDHRTTKDAIPKNQGTYTTRSGYERKKWTTRGWEFFVRWKDGSGDWVKMKDIKESYPVPLADYAVSNNIHEEPAFAWWVPHTLKKRI